MHIIFPASSVPIHSLCISHTLTWLFPSFLPTAVIDNQPIESCVCMPSEDILTSSGQSVSLCKLLLGTLLTFLMFL